MYNNKYLDEVNKVGVTLCVKCNMGEEFSDKKGFLIDMFNM